MMLDSHSDNIHHSSSCAPTTGAAAADHRAPPNKRQQQHSQHASSTTGMEGFDTGSEFVEVYAAGGEDALLLIPRRDVIAMPNLGAQSGKTARKLANSAKKLQLCPRFDAAVGPSSCSQGARCRFMHAVTDKAVVHDIHINYAWRRPQDVTYATFASDAAAAHDVDEEGYDEEEQHPHVASFDVAPPNEYVVADTIPAHLVLKTRALESNRRVLSHCAHYYFNRVCNRGSQCYFIHAVSLASSQAPSNNKKNGRNNRQHQQQQQQQADSNSSEVRRQWGRTQPAPAVQQHQKNSKSNSNSNSSKHQENSESPSAAGAGAYASATMTPPVSYADAVLKGAGAATCANVIITSDDRGDDSPVVPHLGSRKMSFLSAGAASSVAQQGLTPGYASLSQFNSLQDMSLTPMPAWHHHQQRYHNHHASSNTSMAGGGAANLPPAATHQQLAAAAAAAFQPPHNGNGVSASAASSYLPYTASMSHIPSGSYDGGSAHVSYMSLPSSPSHSLHYGVLEQPPQPCAAEGCCATCGRASSPAATLGNPSKRARTGGKSSPARGLAAAFSFRGDESDDDVDGSAAGGVFFVDPLPARTPPSSQLPASPVRHRRHNPYSWSRPTVVTYTYGDAGATPTPTSDDTF